MTRPGLLRGEQGAPGLGLAWLALVALTLFYWATGALLPGETLPHYATSARQITGMALMLILLPAYMLAAWCIGQRRSLELVEQLRPSMPDPAAADAVARRIRTPMGAKGWFWGSAIGISFGLLNTEPLKAFSHEATRVLEVGISFGQVFMWWVIGLMLVDRVQSARAFRALGEVIPFDLFRLDLLRPLARAGIIDVVIVAGALLFPPLQSLDAEFRSENYRFALTVATPAMAFFVVWPLRSVHARIRADRARRIEQVEAQLAELAPGAPSTPGDTRSLESLLAHRDRLRAAPTWPLDLRLVSRIVIYLIIPPLAWAGAAVVERLVDTALGSG